LYIVFAMTISILTLTYILIVANVGLSLYAMRDAAFRDRHVLHIGAIRHQREYGRFLVSAFLHGGWWHLLFNMYALYLFGKLLNDAALDLYPTPIAGLPPWAFLLIYAGSLLGGSGLTWLVHRHHEDFRSLGASGAINGLIFATIFWLPELRIWFLPGWLFGGLYVLASLYGIRNRWGNLAHEAHLGGALSGLLLALLLRPDLLAGRWLLVAALVVPSIAFLYMILRMPERLRMPSSFRFAPVRVREVVGKVVPPRPATPAFGSVQEEIDFLLDKGVDKLSSRERARLEELSRSLGE